MKILSCFRYLSKFRYIILCALLFLFISDDWLYVTRIYDEPLLIVTILPFVALFSIFGRKVFAFYGKSFTALNNKQEYNAEFFKLADAGCRYTRGASILALFYCLMQVATSLSSMEVVGRWSGSAIASLGLGVILSEFYFGHLRNIYSKD